MIAEMTTTNSIRPFVSMLTVILAIVAAGCTFNNPTGPNFEPARLTTKDKALIYFYRPPGESFGNDRTYYLSVNGQRSEDFLHGGYFSLEMNPGTVELITAWNFTARALLPGVIEAVDGPETARLNFELKAGETYYVRMSPEPKFTSYTPTLALVSPQIGYHEISSCRLAIKKPGEPKAMGGSVSADGSKSNYQREGTPATTERENVSPLGHAVSLPSSRQLTAAELKSEWPNHTVIMPRAKIHFDLDGTMQGETKNGNSSDVGTYWITNEDQLCLKWERWRSGKTFCLFVKREGSEFVYVKPDGTIARRFSKVPGNLR